MRKGYLQIYNKNKDRMVLIDANRSVSEVADEIKAVFLQRTNNG